MTDPALDVGRVRWSLDGTRLAFSDQTENRTPEIAQDIWIVNAHGSGLTKEDRVTLDGTPSIDRAVAANRLPRQVLT